MLVPLKSILLQVAYHDHDVIQNSRKAREIRGRSASLVVPGEERPSSSEEERLAHRVLAELLEELEEVGSIIVVDRIAAETLAVWVLPAREASSVYDARHAWVDLLKVNTVQIVLLDEVDAGLDKGGAVLLGTKVGGKVPASSPATDRDQSFDALHYSVS